MKNLLNKESSPYLLQHAQNPVNWYPWCKEAFEQAKKEDKPIFLSIGYSTCHWCHVMAHESFEDKKIADILNEYFISIKVDKEERPDIDSVYMSVCQAMTGHGGWPTTIFMTPDQKPFFAGTYFPKTSRFGQMGLQELLLAVCGKWKKERGDLLKSAESILKHLEKVRNTEEGMDIDSEHIDTGLMKTAYKHYCHLFDKKKGGFGKAPKFPTPHNLLFLMRYYEKTKKEEALNMAEKTLLQMYRGGIFDHIGGGFSRYSTDDSFLVPHFEKMLYDNALLIMAYCKAYQITKKQIFLQVAQTTANYILREMTSGEGGFYSAQDADSEGVEGKYYLFSPEEILGLCEKEGKEFNEYFDITREGNFEGKSIPNLLKQNDLEVNLEEVKKKIYEYRKKRYQLHLDDKILTSWNGLMIVAMCWLYRVSGEEMYLEAAIKAQNFLDEKLSENDRLFVSYREGRRKGAGFLDDYANEIFSLLALYEATFDKKYLEKAQKYYQVAMEDFYDKNQGGFFLYGKENEQLILCPKETYDGAIFSGNSVMAANMLMLSQLLGGEKYEKEIEKHFKFLLSEAKEHPTGYAMFLISLLEYWEAPDKVTIVKKEGEAFPHLSTKIPLDTRIIVFEEPTKECPLLNNKTTFYVCKGRACLPPVNELSAF